MRASKPKVAASDVRASLQGARERRCAIDGGAETTPNFAHWSRRSPRSVDASAIARSRFWFDAKHVDAPGPLLVDNGIDIIRLSASSDYKREAREGYFKATQIFDNRDVKSRNLLKLAPSQ